MNNKQNYSKYYDVIVIGAGPGGSTAARSASLEGARVLLIDKSFCPGVPVRCAEFIPYQLGEFVELSGRHIAQRIESMNTHLPDGTVQTINSPGFVLHRSIFDKDLVVAARQAGSEIAIGMKAIQPTDQGILVETSNNRLEIKASVVIGADGSNSTVRKWFNISNQDFLYAAQCEVVLGENRNSDKTLQVYFHPFIEGGYAWIFPKGKTANVGVASLKKPKYALELFLDLNNIPVNSIIARTGGLIPVGGPPSSTVHNRFLLCGDAAGQTHPITGAGIAHAIRCGQIAGKYAAKAALEGSLSYLEGYEQEWRDLFHATLVRARKNRRYMQKKWTNNKEKFSRIIQESWITFPGYAKRKF